MLTRSSLTFGSGLQRRIVKAPMNPLRIAGEHGAPLGGLVAHRDYEVESVRQKIVLEDGRGRRVNRLSRHTPGTEGVGSPFGQLAQQRFSELRASRIARAEKQDAKAAFRHD